ncbi:MAG: membrane protein insertion efficiency factor YidD [Parvularculaceae bacterium]|nr:membrane protein insertion efficiency factor YidD [Parvularculaceae bacterium]
MNGSPQQQGFPTRAALSALWLYKRTLSPVFYLLGARCRHLPTCSDYAADAFRRHGAHKGFWLTISRLARCHPFGSHGYDPAPENLPDHGWSLWRYGDWSWRARRVQEAADAGDAV